MSFLCVIMAHVWLPSVSCVSMARKCRSSFSSFLSRFKVRCQENKSTAWISFPSLWTTCNFIVESCTHMRGSRSVLPERLRIHFNETWSVRIVDLVPLRLDTKSSTDRTDESYFLCVVLILRPASVRDLGKYPIRFVDMSGRCGTKKNRIWTLQTLMSRVIWPVKYGTAGKGRETSAFFRVF